MTPVATFAVSNPWPVEEDEVVAGDEAEVGVNVPEVEGPVPPLPPPCAACWNRAKAASSALTAKTCS